MNSTILWRQSLKVRITLLTLVIVTISIWSLAFFARQLLREDMQQLSSKQQFSIVSFMAAQLNEELGERLSALEGIADGIPPAVMGYASTLQTILEQHEDVQKLFNAGLMITGLDGTAIADVPIEAGRLGTNYIDRDFMVSVLKEGKPTIGQPVIGKKLQAPVFVMAVPIRGYKGEVIGALTGVTNLGAHSFLDKYTDNRYGRTGGFQVVSRKHRMIITASDAGEIMKKDPAPGVNPVLDRFYRDQEGSATYTNQQGDEQLGSVKGVPVADWQVRANLPATEAFAPIRDMQLNILLSSLFLTFLSGGLIWWVLGRQLEPLFSAARTLANLSDKDQPAQPLPVSCQDEIGKLISGFNQLLEKLGQREEEVRQLAFYDPLTQLPNRRLLEDRLIQTMAASKRSACYGALMFLDLDNFKPVNDTHGHEVGDMLLVEAAYRLKHCVREADTVARIGGDEFVVLISQLDSDKANSATLANGIAEKIRSILSEPYLLAVRHEGEGETCVEHHCTASIGVALFVDYETSREEILNLADAAMYQAKEGGRDAVRMVAEMPQQDGLGATGTGTGTGSMGLVRLTWHSAYESGNALIDSQHRALFDGANELLNAILSERSSDEMSGRIQVLIRDVSQHFKDEEVILAEAGFPGAAGHAAIHRELVDQALRLVTRLEAGTLALGELFEFLANDVIAKHMLGADRVFFPYLRKH